MQKKTGRLFVRALAVAAAVAAALFFTLLAPIDYTPLDQQPFYRRMMKKLDTMQLDRYRSTQSLQAGWSQFSIVPDHPVRMAGYGPRKKFTAVKDSLFIRILAVNNGAITIYFVSADLLLFPPVIKRTVLQALDGSSRDFVFFGASHTHYGVGGWAPSLVGRILMGGYEAEWVEHTARQIVRHMRLAAAAMRSVRLYSWEADAAMYTLNRAFKTSDRLDGKLRGITVEREDGAKAMLFVYGAHPTITSSKSTTLSNDYVAETINVLARHENVAFVQFMGGMMASQTPARFPVDNQPAFLGQKLAELMIGAAMDSLPRRLDISVKRLSVEQGPSQLRISKNLRLRDWTFRFLMGPLKAELALVQIDRLLFIGASCDFSGQISHENNYDSMAASYGKRLIITGFNGEYTGYITSDLRYQGKSDDEVQILNWVGPYFGDYYTRMVRRILARSDSVIVVPLSINPKKQ